MRRASRTCFVIIVLCAALGVSAVACSDGGETWERIVFSGELRVGLDPTYPPFELAEGASLVGLDVDLANALASELGLRAEFVHLGYDGLYDALGTEQVDVLISALVIFPERTRDFAYSEPYFNAGEILVHPASETELEEMADLGGRIVAVELGAQGHLEAQNWARRLPGMSVVPFESADEALNAVERREADAAVVDAVGGRLYLATHPELERSPVPVTVEPYSMVVRIEDGILLEKLNTSLETLRDSGQLEEFVAMWLDSVSSQ